LTAYKFHSLIKLFRHHFEQARDYIFQRRKFSFFFNLTISPTTNLLPIWNPTTQKHFFLFPITSMIIRKYWLISFHAIVTPWSYVLFCSDHPELFTARLWHVLSSHFDAVYNEVFEGQYKQMLFLLACFNFLYFLIHY